MNIYVIAITDTGLNLACSVQRLSDQFYREADNETFTSSSALIPLAEDDDGTYRAILDGNSWENGLYLFRIYDTDDSSLLSGYTSEIKDGKEISIGSKDDVYHADIEYIKNQFTGTDEYTVTWFKNAIRITSGITSPTLQIINRADGANIIAATAMTQIGTTGSYKLDITSSNDRQEDGSAYIVIAAAVIDGINRSFSWILGRDAI